MIDPARNMEAIEAILPAPANMLRAVIIAAIREYGDAVVHPGSDKQRLACLS
jgi:hypothetical protein